MSLDALVDVRRSGFHLHAAVRADPSQVVAIVGPNGSGKTTLLRALAGLEPLAAGRVEFRGRVLDDVTAGVAVPPERREVGLVFQRGALFPHLSVLDNVGYGPRALGASRAAARETAATWLDRLDLTGLADRRPATLSGGEARRVALARALVTEPALLLLDEPFAGVDAASRRALRSVVAAQARDRVTVLVAHDPVDALTLADTVVVLDSGRVVQAAPPHDVVARPASPWIGELVGVNVWTGVASAGVVAVDGGGTLHAADVPDGRVVAAVPPRAVALSREQPHGSARNVWRGEVTATARLAGRVRVEVATVPPVVAEVTPAAYADLALETRGLVWVSLKAAEVTTYLS